MKKILFWLLWIISLWLLNFSSARFVVLDYTEHTTDEWISFTMNNFCFKLANSLTTTNNITVNINWVDYINYNIWDQNLYNINKFFCYLWTGEILLSDQVQNTYTIRFYDINSIIWSSWSSSSCDYSDYILLYDVTESYCTNRYSDLINESDITSWYCETEFWLIDPEDCPASWWTGDVQWSAFFVNSHQVQGASNIYLWLPDFLSWDYTYIDSWSTLQVDVENEWDQEYIQSILDIQSYHPDKDQFAQSFAWFLTLLMPYIIITLFIIFIWRLIKRIFR